MTDAKKFMFDVNNFNQDKVEEVVYSEEQLALAKTQSAAQAKAEALRESQQQQEARLNELMQKMVTLAEKMAKNEDRREVEKSVDAVKLAMQIVHKMLPKFARENAVSEMENVIVQAIEARRDEPRLVVIVPTAHLEALKGRVDALVAQRNFAGKLILIADDSLAETDCRVEWADGGAERLYERLFAQIENEFAKAVTGMSATLEAGSKPNDK